MSSVAQEITADGLSKPQRIYYDAVIKVYEATVMKMPVKSGKTTITKLLIKEMTRLDEESHGRV